MSFGFSVSDFVYCAHIAYKLSVEFKEAPGACRSFRNELVFFHQILLETQSLLGKKKNDLDDSVQAMLATSAYICKELLYVQILGYKNVPNDLQSLTYDTLPMFDTYIFGLRRRFGERKFAKKIPQFQSAISSRINALTALNVILISNSQENWLESQARREEAYGRLEEDMRVSRVQSKYTSERFDEGQAETKAQLQQIPEQIHSQLEEGMELSQRRLESTSERLEQSQARMEAQLQQILASPQRHATPILSHSLNASSPEGRQTWMNLGRLLRAEGITPSMIDQNRDLLVKAMKTSLEQGELPAESISQSFRTAPEWSGSMRIEDYPASFNSFESSSRPHPLVETRFCHSDSAPLLGSAPPRNAIFSDAFLERHNGKARSLDQSQNVRYGLESLLSGMNHVDTQQHEDLKKPAIEAASLQLPGLRRCVKSSYVYNVSPNNGQNLQSFQPGRDKAATLAKPIQSSCQYHSSSEFSTKANLGNLPARSKDRIDGSFQEASALSGNIWLHGEGGIWT